MGAGLKSLLFRRQHRSAERHYRHAPTSESKSTPARDGAGVAEPAPRQRRLSVNPDGVRTRRRRGGHPLYIGRNHNFFLIWIKQALDLKILIYTHRIVTIT